MGQIVVQHTKGKEHSALTIVVVQASILFCFMQVCFTSNLVCRILGQSVAGLSVWGVLELAGSVVGVEGFWAAECGLAMRIARN